MFKNYFDKIIKTSDSYLKKRFNNKDYSYLLKKLEKNKFNSNEEYVVYFNQVYNEIVKKNYQAEYKKSDKKLTKFIENKDTNL